MNDYFEIREKTRPSEVLEEREIGPWRKGKFGLLGAKPNRDT